ncbi:MAG: Fe-S cluster biogenesis protein NfuA [Candidatus Omnitrophota bacterium]|jgi:Fe-S cluster biogenesis protein NfuA
MTDKKVLTVSAETTPNPETIKFLINREFDLSSAVNFTNAEEAAGSPMANQLFGMGNIIGVMIGKSFISITKEESTSWENLAGQCVSAIQSVFDSNDDPLGTNLPQSAPENSEDDQNPIILKIKSILDTEIRPAVAMDGGDIVFDSYADGIVKLKLQGACSSCPSSMMTLKMGVENRLKALIPEIKEVEQV